jgi:cysteine desulfurase
MAVEIPENYIYLDYAATAPLCEEAARAMEPYAQPGRARVASGMNANSLHQAGRAAFEQLEAARKSVAASVGAGRPSEIVFTSGSTEADNAALFGLARAACAKAQKRGAAFERPRIITSAIEHDAVLAPARRLEREGFDVVYLAPNAGGFITLEALEAALNSQTVLVSIQLANSEVGSVMDIASLAAAAHAAGALFHTDATQALGKIALDVRKLDVDAASFSSHKVGGPYGTGALYLKARTPFEASMLGGGQETSLRSGTQNVPGVVGFAAAARAAAEGAQAECTRLSDLRRRLYEQACALPKVRRTVKPELAQAGTYLPNICSFLVPGIESETLVVRLDAAGFAVSGGSACASHSLEPSHVLTAMGIKPDDALCSLRVSFGRYTTAADIDAFVRALKTSIA